MVRCNSLCVAAALVVFGIGCVNDAHTGDNDVSAAGSPAALTIQNDFEDGTVQGWIPRGPVTLTNTTTTAFTGTHSLLTTGRTAGFNGPSLNLTGQLTQGATYSIGVAVRLVTGQAPTTIRVTMQRTLTDGTQAFDTIASNSNVTDAAWVSLSGTYSFSTPVNGLLLYVEATSATASYYIDAFSLTQGLFYDFEDGTTQGWGPFGSPTVANSTDVAFSGTHSLKTTNRTASFNGPSISLQGKLTKGATYQITLSVRMVAGQPTTTIQPTIQRTPTGGSSSFDTVMTISNVTDQAWVTASALYSFTTDNSGLTFYVQTSSGTASYYIDAVNINQVAGPPGPPGNTTGASSSFESGTLEGWKSRTGGETVANSTADAHGGTHSLLTTNRTATFQGPSFDVTNVMFNGSQYVVSVWAKLAPGSADTQLRVSLQRNAGTITTFHTVVGNTTVTAGAWVRLQATYNVALANSSLTLYVESASGTPSFYIDDFSITYVPPAIAETNIPSVYQSMLPFFPIIGAAVIPADITGQPGVLLSKHFNSMTSGNDMKWDATEPTEGSFTFTQADAEVSFAQTNNMHVRGHTLVWANQTPAWVFNDASGNPMTATPANQALLTQRIQNHIQAVMTHFGSKVPIWDVVNEPIDESQPDGYRRSNWFNILGPQYIPIALQAARAANPTAKLYINEFNTTIPAKRDFLLALVRSLKSQGIPLDGIGHQMHNNVQFPSAQSIIDAVNMFDTTGVEQAVTEMDVSIYAGGSLSTPFTSYTDIPQSRHIQDAYAYLGFVQAFKQVASKIVSITIWGTSDDKSWLTSATKVDAPLLFDPSLQHKYDYWAFVDPLQIPGANLSVTMNAASMTVPAGQGVTYAVTVTNVGDTNQQPYDPTDDDLPAANVTLTVPIPSHTVFQTLLPPAGWNCTGPAPGSSGQVQCTVPSLAVNAPAQLTLTVAVNDCSTANGSTITASATVASTTANPNPTPNTSASVGVQVTNSAPVISANGSLNMTVECATTFADPGATAQDSCEGPVPVTATSTVNTSAVGSYSVTYNSSDRAGDQAVPVVRSVQVSDTTAPVVMLVGPNPMTLECGTAFADPGATALDSCVGALPVTAVPDINSGVPGSGYDVMYLAVDPSGNTGAATRAVVVSDTTAPSLDLVDLTIIAPGLKIVVNGLTITINGQSFPLRSGSFMAGGHTVTFAGTTITIDGQTYSIDGRTLLLLPPNHDFQAFSMADLIAAATDSCDTTVGVGTAVITQVTSDEAVTGGGSGNTQPDIIIGADCKSLQLRVERDGTGNGRVYNVGLRLRDASGNQTIKTAQVMVPHDPLLPFAIDSGPSYTVTSSCP
jgi:endo-1,4-beta-xylanase